MRPAGITLIALIITIIILLILAGVVLNMVIGENGIFSKANKAKEDTTYSTALEEINLIILEAQADAVKDGRKANIKDVVEELRKDERYTYVINTSPQFSEYSYIINKSPQIATIDQNGGTIKNPQAVTEDIKVIYVIHKGYEFEIGEDLKVKATGQKENESESNSIIGDKNIDKSLLEENDYDQTKNIFDYNQGARVTYVTNPYAGSVTAINNGYTGDSTSVGSTSGFWSAGNGWNHQGSVENDASIDNVTYTHNGVAKGGSSATTLHGGNTTKQTIIIDPRAYYGDTQNYTFEIDDLYLAAANSDGNVGNYSIYISNGGADVATNPDDSSWTSVTSGNLTEDWKLIKVYSGNLKFKYIKLELYSRDKSYMELAAIKGFKKVSNSAETTITIKQDNNKITVLAANQNVGIKEIKIIMPDGKEKKYECNNFGILKKTYTIKSTGEYEIVITDKNGETKELKFEISQVENNIEIVSIENANVTEYALITSQGIFNCISKTTGNYAFCKSNILTGENAIDIINACDDDLETKAVVPQSTDVGYIYVDESAWEEKLCIDNASNCCVRAYNKNGSQIQSWIIAPGGEWADGSFIIPKNTEYLYFTTWARRCGDLYFSEIYLENN